MLRSLVLLSLFSVLLLAATAPATPDEQVSDQSAIKRIILKSQDIVAGAVKAILDAFGVCTPEKDLPADLATLTGMVMVISLLIYAALYMMGKLLNAPGVNTLFYNEIYTLIGNAVLLVLVIAIVGVMDELKIYDKAQEYLVKVLVKNGIFQLFLINFHQIITLYSRIQIPLNPVASGHWFSVQADFTQAIKLILSLTGYILNGSALLTVQYAFKLFLLCLSAKFFLKILFPIGILLRSFYITRGGGNALLGIALAFYIVYPIILYLMAGLYNAVMDIWLIYLQDSFTNWIVTLISWSIVMLTRLAEVWIESYLLGQSTAASLVAKAFSSTLLPAVRTGALITMTTQIINMFLNLFFGYGIFIMLFGFVISPITIFLTLIASGEISERLGTKINLAVFTRLI